MTPTVLVPPLAAMLPLKLHVTSPLALLQVQPEPVADTNVKPAGNWSRSCAVMAAAVPELETVSRYVLCVPTLSPGVGAAFVIDKLGVETVPVDEEQFPGVAHDGPGVGGVGPPVGSIEA